MRLIDADKLKEIPMFNGQYDKKNANENFIFGIETVIDFINELPTEPVRCKDCRYCIKEPNGELYCDILAVGYEPLGSKKVTEDWFCADGDRR